jgi:heptosyltransferase I
MITYSRSKNLLLVIMTLFHTLVYGKATKKPTLPPKKVLFVYLTKNIGDMIFATPIFRALKVVYPNTKIGVVGIPKNKIILEGNSDVDEYIVCPESEKELITLIKTFSPDYAVSLVPSVLDLACLKLANVTSIATFEVNNPKAHTVGYKMILPCFIRVPFTIGQYVGRENLKVLEPLAVQSNVTEKHLFATESARRSVAEFLSKESVDTSQKKIAIFSPGGGTLIKRWPAERFAAVADHLTTEYGMKIAVIGGPSDKDAIQLFLSSLKLTKPLIFVDSSLDELKAFVSRGSLLLANDSGPVYIAEAFKVPTLVVVGPTDENEHPPQGEMNRIVKAPHRGAAELSGHLEGFDQVKARKQIESVSVSMVTEEVDKLIAAIQVHEKI